MVAQHLLFCERKDKNTNILDALMLVDQDILKRNNLSNSNSGDLTQQADKLRALTNVFGPHTYCVALISENDRNALRIFGQLGFETIPVNGNRPQVLQNLTEVFSASAQRGEIRQIVFVSPDKNFIPLYNQTIDHVKLAIWIPGENIPSELKHDTYNPRLLSEILPLEKSFKVDVRLDFENMLFGLEKSGHTVTPAEFIQMIRSAVSDMGEISAITAYADWRIIREHTQFDFQDDFEGMGIKTRYQKSMRGKNSADMEIANDIHSMVEKDAIESPDVIVLASHDRDFRPTLETARKRGKKIVLLALPTGLSHELRLAADEIRYLPTGKSDSSDDNFAVSQTVTPWDEFTELVFVIDRWLYQQKWGWIYQDRLMAMLGTEPKRQALLQKALRAEVLIPVSEHRGAFKLNPVHALVKAIRLLRDWVPARLEFCLHTRQMPYVDTNFLARGIQMDPRFTRIGVSGGLSEVSAWLELLHKSGWIAKQIRNHPNTPRKLIATWSLQE